MLRIDPTTFPAFALDLDGVVTDTAAVHAAAWKRLFDELLGRLAGDRAWQPFDVGDDYRTYVDGRPRRDGLRGFLASRGLVLPEGAVGDDTDRETISGLAERKNRYFRERLDATGVNVFPDAVAFLRRARALGIQLAVVTASQNCTAILTAARLVDAFDVRVDGNDIVQLRLRGKPAPDSFVEAARRLGTEPARVVVLEDAIAGVEAARKGGFGLVIGVDRTGHAEELRAAGAHATVASLDELELAASARVELR